METGRQEINVVALRHSRRLHRVYPAAPTAGNSRQFSDRLRGSDQRRERSEWRRASLAGAPASSCKLQGNIRRGPPGSPRCITSRTAELNLAAVELAR